MNLPTLLIRKKKQSIKKGDLESLTKSTNFGKDELKTLEKSFRSYDKNKSGSLDMEEFSKLLIEQKLFPGLSNESLKQLFQSFDSDNSGSLDFKEIATSFSIVMRGTLEQKLEYMFEVYDKDNSGTLDKSEVNMILDQMKAVAHGLNRDPSKVVPFAEGILKKLDTDNNGIIDKKEWIKIGLETPSLNDLLTGGQYHESNLLKKNK